MEERERQKALKAVNAKFYTGSLWFDSTGSLWFASTAERQVGRL